VVGDNAAADASSGRTTRGDDVSPDSHPQDVREQELPGIGKRYDHATEDGLISVVIHHSGRRDLYVTEKATRNAPPTVVTLTDDQARRLGTVLAGAYFQPTIAQRIEAVVGGLVIDWVTMHGGSPGLDRTIADLEVRRNTRMTIVAILRHDASGGDEVIVVPEPSEVLRAGDKLVVIGRPDDLPAFVGHVTG
jgi:TrkA domain protein